MYWDHILLTVGSVLLLAVFLLSAILFRSRRRSQEYRRTLRDETEKIDMMETMRRTCGTGASQRARYPPETGRQTEELPSAALSDQTEKLEDTASLMPRQAAGYSETAGCIGQDLDLSPLNGKYELLRELSGGGMSRIFLARHMKLGSEWIVKFVDGKHAELANEADVLKKMNHINLPQIIDIFQSYQGTFLVERYIEGYTLEEVLRQNKQIKEGLVCQWGTELSQVLNYLHNLDTAIIHCDLKPSNIMVTYDNRLVLIDFGISKRQGVDERSLGLTYRYAAPEQFQGDLSASEAAVRRFGRLPAEQRDWRIDARTDLYSVGVILFELVTGSAPVQENRREIFDCASSGLAAVISRCLEIDPADRYQSARELTLALEDLNMRRISMARSLVRRRVASVCCGLMLVAGLSATASGAYLNRVETQAVVVMEPSEAVVTQQQGVQLLIQKKMPGGKIVTLEPSQIQWTYGDSSIARLEGNRLIGLNTGETTVSGQYRNKSISLHVTVAEPVEELVDISLRYPERTAVSLYAGNGEREFVDGPLETCSFVSPESITGSAGRLCISDSGMIRLLEDGAVTTIYWEPDYLTADKIIEWNGTLYILTGVWEDDDGSYYGFIRMADGRAEVLFYTEAEWSRIQDFSFTSDGSLWFIWENVGMGTTELHMLDPLTLEENWVMDLPAGTRALAVDARDNLYFSVPDDGVILKAGKGEDSWTYFAGVVGERNFIDGTVANFYRPTSLAVKEDSLYVLDFDTVRRIPISGVEPTETIAGIPIADTSPDVQLGAGCSSVLPASELASLAVDGEGRLLLGDPKNSVIYVITDE